MVKFTQPGLSFILLFASVYPDSTSYMVLVVNFLELHVMYDCKENLFKPFTILGILGDKMIWFRVWNHKQTVPVRSNMFLLEHDPFLTDRHKRTLAIVTAFIYSST
jgi:hypothetical protein